MNRKSIILATLALSCLMSCGENKDEEVRPIAVKVVSVKPTTESASLKFSGTIEENSGTAVSFATAGTVKHVYVSNGQSVVKGQLLADIDPTTLEQLHNAALATLSQAEDAYERMKQLHDANSLPEIQWVDVQSRLAQAQSSEQIARRALKDARIVAPVSGIIAGKSVEVGQNVLPSLTVMKIVEINNVKVNVSVPESEISTIGRGSEVNITVPALGNAKFRGVVSEKDVTANMLSRTYDVKALINNASHQLMPGMICSASIGQNSTSSAITLPIDAVQLSNKNFYYVWTVINGKAHRTFVEVGSVTPTGVVITGGLDKSDIVIVEGQQKVSEGMEVSYDS